MKRQISAAALLALTVTFGGDSRQSSDLSPLRVRLVEAAADAGVTLVNLSGGSPKNYLIDVAGNGAAFFDYDNDNDLDLLIVNGSTFENFREGGDPMAALYQNDGEGKFSDVTARSGLNKRGWGQGVCVADYDNDGFRDFYLTGYGSNALFHNNGDGTFTEATEQASVDIARWSAGCSFGDYDRDGFVDLYVANYILLNEEVTPVRGAADPSCKFMGKDVMCGPRGLPGEPDVLFRNNGDGTFTDATEAAGIDLPAHYGLGVVFTDLNNDGWPDIYVANDSNPNFLFQNNRDGTFSEIALDADVALSEEGLEQAGMGIAIGDYDNDGNFDIFVTNFSQDANTLYRNEGEGLFAGVTFTSGLGVSSLPHLAWGTGFTDLDNNGRLDLFVANGHIYPGVDGFGVGSTFRQRNQLYANLGDGRFIEVTDQAGAGMLVERSSRGVAFGDYDNDGDSDILVTNLDESPSLLRTDGWHRNHWITLRLEGAKSNRDAIGARVTARNGDRTQVAEVRSGGSYLSNHDSRVHFGLGEEARIEHLEIRWPSGLVETFEEVAADRFLLAREGEGISEIKIPTREDEEPSKPAGAPHPAGQASPRAVAIAALARRRLPNCLRPSGTKAAFLCVLCDLCGSVFSHHREHGGHGETSTKPAGASPSSKLSPPFLSLRTLRLPAAGRSLRCRLFSVFSATSVVQSFSTTDVHRTQSQAPTAGRRTQAAYS